MAGAAATIAALKASADALCELSLGFVCDAALPATQTALSPKQLELTRLLRYEEWLKSRVLEFQSYERRRELTGDGGEHDGLAALRESLFAAAVDATRESMLVERVHEYTAIAELVMDANGVPIEGGDELLAALLHSRDQKVAESLVMADEVAQLQRQLLETNLRIKEKMDANRSLRAQLAATVGERAAQDAARDVNPDLERANAHAVILRNVFQALIFESGVNWAENEGLRQFILSIDLSPDQVEVPDDDAE